MRPEGIAQSAHTQLKLGVNPSTLDRFPDRLLQAEPRLTKLWISANTFPPEGGTTNFSHNLRLRIYGTSWLPLDTHFLF